MLTDHRLSKRLTDRHKGLYLKQHLNKNCQNEDWSKIFLKDTVLEISIHSGLS